MDEKNKISAEFAEYMKTFKDQPLKEKQSIIYEQLKTLSAYTHHLCTELHIPNDVLLNQELLDLNKPDYTEDDFAEAIIVLINSVQNSICDYSIGISDMLDKIG